ncbi:hypothetical protein FQR65_LT11935 [Abscondita terminalis]|nr:hypothetical protein FQR65_LT11935 [Abscondita terminalis]
MPKVAFWPHQLVHSNKKPVEFGRRRPATVVKALTTSELGEKYEQLLNKRLAIADLELQKIKDNVVWQKEKREMERELIQLEI